MDSVVCSGRLVLALPWHCRLRISPWLMLLDGDGCLLRQERALHQNNSDKQNSKDLDLPTSALLALLTLIACRIYAGMITRSQHSNTMEDDTDNLSPSSQERPPQRQRVDENLDESIDESLDESQHQIAPAARSARVAQPAAAARVAQERCDGLIPIERELLQNKGEFRISRMKVNASSTATIKRMAQLDGSEIVTELSDDSDDDITQLTVDTMPDLLTKGANYPDQHTNSIMGVISGMKILASVETRSYGNRAGNQRNRQVQHNKRILHFVDPLGQPGNNVYAIIVDQHRTTIFDNDPTIRDKGYFRKCQMNYVWMTFITSIISPSIIHRRRIAPTHFGTDYP
eukprot:scaffold12895_cov164-Skeletonema_dohrnii-CCMP3373.AAC.4